jgi:predicted MFS family arabinose efflux permease
MAMLADAAELWGLDQGLAAALMNLAWAGGQIVGSGIGGAVAKATGDAVPMTITAGLCAATLLVLTRLALPRDSKRHQRREAKVGT